MLIIQHTTHYTTTVLLLATLDVKNMFKCLRWNDVLNALGYNFSMPHYILAMISSYLSNRQLVYNTSSRPSVNHITSGPAQGSILIPDLWYVNYHGILREDIPEEAFLVGHADDIVTITTARNTEEAQRKLRRVMLRTKTWWNSHGLDPAMYKIELLLITGHRILLHVEISIGNEVIRIKSLVRYLDPKLMFLYQIQYSASKAQNIVGQFSILMANIGSSYRLDLDSR